jgi:hypothetical protein
VAVDVHELAGPGQYRADQPDQPACCRPDVGAADLEERIARAFEELNLESILGEPDLDVLQQMQ